ncbi:hypothetical protein HNR53_003437 [Bacillus benzoevorans]|uniref:Uncharacterized protein n=1 Tax=Bacillus benzoevorans TaxID=1456 RepID=A0A7X0LWJ6_9BACI|nr:hypothetical protein [Bacillus benzoevorans]
MTYQPAVTQKPAINEGHTLNQMPPIRLSENGVFLLALAILVFIFFFTRQETPVS